jgi:hypothetical protein
LPSRGEQDRAYTARNRDNHFPQWTILHLSALGLFPSSKHLFLQVILAWVKSEQEGTICFGLNDGPWIVMSRTALFFLLPSPPLPTLL